MSKHLKQGKIATEILIILIIVVFTTALILFLTKSGVVEVEEGQELNFLNTDYLPLQNLNTLTVKEFSFCTTIDQQFNCQTPTTRFSLNQEINFLVTIESNTVGNQIILLENYRIKDSNNQVIYDIDGREDYKIEQKSGKQKDLVTITDYFTLNYGQSGEYTLELILKNPLLNKEIILNKKFEIE